MAGDEQPIQRPSIEEMVRRFGALANEVCNATKEVHFDLHDPRQAGAMALHGTLLELARGITELLKVGDATGPPILLRAMFEASVDLKNLVSDADYLYNMRAAWLDQKRRLGAGAEAGNPYLKRIVADPQRDATIAELNAELKTLADNGHKPLGVWERFERAEESNRYLSVYWYLCTHSHNNLNALQDRHVEETPAGPQLVYFRDPQPEEAQMYLDVSAGMLANSIASIKELIEGRVEGLGPVGAALDDFRALYPWPSKADPASAEGTPVDSLGRKPQERDPA